MAKDIGKTGSFIEAISGQMKPFFDVQWKDFFTNAFEFLPNLADEINESLKDKLFSVDDRLWDWVIKLGIDAKIFSEYQVDLFKHFKELPSVVSLGVLIMVVIGIIMQVTLSTGGAATAGISQDMNMKTRPTLADPGSLIRSAFIAPEKIEEVRKILAKHGYSDEQTDYLFLANYTLYDENKCRELYLRKIIGNETLQIRMRELGYTDTRIGELKKSWEIIPGVQDLFWLVGKEAFEPEAVKKLGLGDEFPEAQVEWLEKQGLSLEWAKKYWYAHWDQPSIGMGYEMLHRGVIGEETLDLLFRTVEMPPFWREKLKQIAYQPYTRVDVRRMYNYGILSIKEVLRSYLDSGYDEIHAINMTRFAIEDSEKEEKGLTQAQIMSGLGDRIFSRNEAIDALRSLGLSSNKIDFLLASQDYDEESAVEKSKIEVIKFRYIDRYIDRFEAQAALQRLDIPSSQMFALLETWDISILKDQKMPSKTDLGKLFKKGIINQDTYFVELGKLGYNTVYAGWYFKLLTS
jgi:hypothetical protein